MEDRHVVMPDIEQAVCTDSIAKGNADVNVAAGVRSFLESPMTRHALFGVFDGHHGPEVAAYAAAHLHECVLAVELVQKQGDHVADKSANNDKEGVLGTAFSLLDKRLMLRCQKENLKSGTTACCLLLDNDIAHLGWCGDSSMGVLRPTGITTLTRRHTPTDPDELKRIEEAGGIVVMIQGEARVNGVLNVSRSFGDIQAKPMISSMPELKTYRLDEDDLLLLLSTDGVWDQLCEETLYGCVLEFVASHPAEDYEKLANHIVEEAKESGASDNLTFLAVFTQPVKRVWEKLREALPHTE